MKAIPLNERIIFALDVPDSKEAAMWVRKLDPHINFFKVGLQLFLVGGWSVVDDIVNRGNKVMLDLKFFDIPETVHLAIEELHNKGVTLATIHGNRAIIEAATSNKKDLKILAVTVLTSFDGSDMKAMGLSGSVKDLVLIRAKKAVELGCDGVVASALEASELRETLGGNFLMVTPGIRPGANRQIQKDDQRRIATAKQAILDGTDHVVIGRPIRTALHPLQVVEDLQNEISEGLALRSSGGAR